MADALLERNWKPLRRPARYEVKTEQRRRPKNVKEQVVKEREFKNIRLQSEQVAEFDYQPVHCNKIYRMVVVRKNLTVEKGENRLFDDVRYFFYITNDRDKTAAEIVFFAVRAKQPAFVAVKKYSCTPRFDPPGAVSQI